MSERVANWLADPQVRDAYLVFCMTVMILPMIVLTIWYRRSIRRTARGHELLERQSEEYTSGTDALQMLRDISGGRYGQDVKRIQHRTYWVVGLWLLANVIAFGVLLIADEMNRPPG